MDPNIDIYLIGFSVLVFLIITFLFIRKISNKGQLKVKIEPVTDTFEIKEFDEIDIKSQKAFDFEDKDHINYQEQKLGKYLTRIDYRHQNYLNADCNTKNNLTICYKKNTLLNKE